MSAKAVWFIECDNRGVDGRLCMSAVGDHHSSADARAFAKLVGWKRKKGKDVCPGCAAEHKEETPT